MGIEIEACRPDELPALHRAMNAAFSDYLVPLSLTFEQFRFMLRQRGFDPALSWVAKSGDRIVSFWLIGRHREEQRKSAYVIATGTLHGHRGRGLSRQVFHCLQAALAAGGKDRLCLEVIENNIAAKRLYDTLGFRSARKLDCYELRSGERTPPPPESIGLRPCDPLDLREQMEAMWNWRPSWQNSFGSLTRVAGEITTLGAFHADCCVGYGVLLRPTTALAQLAVRTEYRRKGLGTAILGALAPKRSKLRILNVDQSDCGSRFLFEALGAVVETTQVEMTRRL